MFSHSSCPVQLIECTVIADFSYFHRKYFYYAVCHVCRFSFQFLQCIAFYTNNQFCIPGLTVWVVVLICSLMLVNRAYTSIQVYKFIYIYIYIHIYSSFKEAYTGITHSLLLLLPSPVITCLVLFY